MESTIPHSPLPSYLTASQPSTTSITESQAYTNKKFEGIKWKSWERKPPKIITSPSTPRLFDALFFTPVLFAVITPPEMREPSGVCRLSRDVVANQSRRRKSTKKSKGKKKHVRSNQNHDGARTCSVYASQQHDSRELCRVSSIFDVRCCVSSAAPLPLFLFIKTDDKHSADDPVLYIKTPGWDICCA